MVTDRRSMEKISEKLALQAVDVSGSLLGNFLLVKMVQRYVNSLGRNGEFLYTFPLPDKVSVSGFNARVGDTDIRGEVREKEEAFRNYDAAIRRGDSAFLLESFRSNVFQVSLGQVDTGEEVAVEIIYTQEVKAVDGEIRIMVPTVVAPRYIPGKPAALKTGPGTELPTDQVPDADFITPPMTDVTYRAEIRFSIDAGRKIVSIHSPSHAVQVSHPAEERAEVTLSEGSIALDRDFILTIGVFGDEIPRCIYGKSTGDEYFAYLTLTPELPVLEKTAGIDYIFLADVSGSMAGSKLDQAKCALSICLRNLEACDRFNLAAFESRLYIFSQEFLPFNQNNLERAASWIDGLQPMGGTEILPAIKFAVGKPSEREKVVMLFTDGQVGNEKEIIRYVRSANANMRLYAMGIDTAVNSSFINGIAEAGNGSAEFAAPGERVDDKVIRQFSRVSAAWMNEIEIMMDGVKLIDAAGGIPQKLFDLEPASFILKLDGPPQGTVSVKGSNSQGPAEIWLNNLQQAGDAEILEKLWAIRRVEELEGYLDACNPRRRAGAEADIVDVSRRYGIISAYTSFVAIYNRKKKLSGRPETLVVPVSPPHGWEMPGGQLDKGVFCCECVDMDSGSPYIMDLQRIPSPIAEDMPVSQESLADSGRVRDSKGDAVKDLAGSQNWDGSFGQADAGPELIIKATAQGIITIAGSSGEIYPYRGQLLKAVDFLLSAGDAVRSSGSLGKAACIALGLCRIRKVLRGEVLKAVVSMMEDIKTVFREDPDLADICSLLEKKDIKGLMEISKTIKF